MAARTLTEHCDNVFAGILLKGNENIDTARDRLALMRGKLMEEHFPEPIMQLLYKVLCYYDDKTGFVIGPQELEDLLADSADAGTTSLLIEQFAGYRNKNVPEDVFRFSIEQVREKKAAKETAEAFTKSMEILRNGITDPKGNELRGQADARAYVVSEIARIDKDLSFQESPEGDMRYETQEMMREYEKQAELNASGGFDGVKFGIDMLDEYLGGVKDGDLALAVGYTSSGKTTLCVQMAWWAAVMQGLNVVYITTETLRAQVRRKVISRHSCLPMFGLGGGSDPQGRLLPGGLNSKDIRRSRLKPHEMDVYPQVLDDFRTNPTYGSFDIVQMPAQGTMSDAFARANRIGREKRIGLLVLDYLELFRPRNSRADPRQGLNDNIQDGKEYASTANDGSGTAVISPWQVSRKARDEAVQGNGYTLQSLGETKKASDTPDTIISVLEDVFRPKERIFEIALGGLKQRDGETFAPFKVDVDYATSNWGQVKQGGLFVPGTSGVLSTLGG